MGKLVSCINAVIYPNARAHVQELPAMKKPAEDPLGNRPGGDQEASGPSPGRDSIKIAELFADERCNLAILDFLATTDVGRTAGPPVAEEGERAASEASEWEDRERGRTVEGG